MAVYGCDISFAEVIRRLERHHGIPAPPTVTDPWEQILLESVVYLADDEARIRAFRTLAETVGTDPEAILAASQEALLGASGLAGILRDSRADKLRLCAEIALREFDGDLTEVIRLPLDKA